MTEPIYEQAWKASEDIRNRVFAIDEFRITPGMLAALASDLSFQASQLRLAFRRANKMSNLELLEARKAELRQAGRDISGKVSRLQSAAIGVHMDAHSLTHLSVDL